MQLTLDYVAMEKWMTVEDLIKCAILSWLKTVK